MLINIMSIFDVINITGNLYANDNSITTTYIPINDEDVCNKKYVDQVSSQSTLQDIYNQSIQPIILLSSNNPLVIKDNITTILSINNTNVSISSLTSPNTFLVSDKPVESSAFKVTTGTNKQYMMADGTLLQYSANSGNSNYYLYDNSDGITATPLNGHIGYNNATQQNATIIYISHLSSDGIDIDVFFTQLTQLQDVYIQDKNSSLNYIKYNIDGTPTIITNSYISIPVIYSIGAGTGLSSFGNNHLLIVSFFTNSVEVDTRLITLETKTQNQTATPAITTINGTTNINNVYTLPTTAPSVGQVIQCVSLGVANWITPTANSFSSLYPFPSSSRTVTTSAGNRTLCCSYTITSDVTFTKASVFYPTSGSDTTRVGIYRGDLTTATLVGQTLNTPPTLNYFTRVLTVISGQSLTFTIGTQIVVAFTSNGSTSSISTTTGILNAALATTTTNGYSSGFPTFISGILSQGATTTRMCLDLI